MKNKSKKRGWPVKWMTEPEAHDYVAAQDYLELHYTSTVARRIVNALMVAPVEQKKAKDILRASGLALLPKSNKHVKKDIDKIKSGKEISPILVVSQRKAIIADGYHRLCALYHISEDEFVSCQITRKE